MNTPNLAAWFERYLTDWTGPKGRLGKIKFRMKNSVFPGDTMVFAGKVTAVGRRRSGVGWVDVSVELTAGDEELRRLQARMACPRAPTTTPGAKGDAWKP